MKTRAQIAEELLEKEERISEWESYGLLEGDTWQHDEPKIEYWYIN